VSAYYNENDPFAAAWLRELIKEGLIADGEVDERSIIDVRHDDLRGFDQCHFFAGIGGWSYALRLAGWGDGRAVWTGSCPCQPFSSAGAQVGGDDPRHLWPAWFRLIGECRPPVLFGEQVAAAIGHGWIDLVFGDLEGLDYACGAAVMGAHSVGAPHIRQRLWFVADAECGTTERQRLWNDGRDGGESDIVGHAGSARLQWRERYGRIQRDAMEPCTRQAVECGGDTSTMGDSKRAEWRTQAEERLDDNDGVEAGRQETSSGQRIHCAWDDLVWLPCRDGKARPTQPGLQPLAHGAPERVGRLRGYGNCIVPQVAQTFIEAYMSL